MLHAIHAGHCTIYTANASISLVDPSSALCAPSHACPDHNFLSEAKWQTRPRCGVGLRRRQPPNYAIAAVPVPPPKSSAPRRSRLAHGAPSEAPPATISSPSDLAANNHLTPTTTRIRRPASTLFMLLTHFPGPLHRCQAPPQRPQLHPLLPPNISPPPPQTTSCPPPRSSTMDSSPPLTRPSFPTSIP
jgi:hypothetical protein